MIFLTTKLILLTFLWCSFEPLKWGVEKLNFQHPFLVLIFDNIQCPKCVGFWLGLIITQNIYIAIVVSICSIILAKLK